MKAKANSSNTGHVGLERDGRKQKKKFLHAQIQKRADCEFRRRKQRRLKMKLLLKVKFTDGRDHRRRGILRPLHLRREIRFRFRLHRGSFRRYTNHHHENLHRPHTNLHRRRSSGSAQNRSARVRSSWALSTNEMVQSSCGSVPSQNETAPGSSGSALNTSVAKSKWVAGSSRDFRTTDCCCSAVAAHKNARRSNCLGDCCCSARKAARMSCCRLGAAHRRLPRAGGRSLFAPIPAPERLPAGSNCRSLAARGHDRWSSLALPKSANCFRSAAGRC